jgi:hypothetical protein
MSPPTLGTRRVGETFGECLPLAGQSVRKSAALCGVILPSAISRRAISSTERLFPLGIKGVIPSFSSRIRLVRRLTKRNRLCTLLRAIPSRAFLLIGAFSPPALRQPEMWINLENAGYLNAGSSSCQKPVHVYHSHLAATRGVSTGAKPGLTLSLGSSTTALRLYRCPTAAPSPSGHHLWNRYNFSRAAAVPPRIPSMSSCVGPTNELTPTTGSRSRMSNG